MDIVNNLKKSDLRIIGQSAEREILFFYHVKKRRIICFDQHAAHERVRYERLLEQMDEDEDVDIMKSKACHGAVRFGDRLSLTQCESLIEKLLRCKVPFRCAHSRRNVAILDSQDEIITNGGLSKNMGR